VEVSVGLIEGRKRGCFPKIGGRSKVWNLLLWGHFLVDTVFNDSFQQEIQFFFVVVGDLGL
jgi:hypothetical protein